MLSSSSSMWLPWLFYLRVLSSLMGNHLFFGVSGLPSEAIVPFLARVETIQLDSLNT